MTAKTLQIVSSDDQDRTLTVYIDHTKYTFWFHGEVPISTVRKIMRHSIGRAIQYLNNQSYKCTVGEEHGKLHAQTDNNKASQN